jgi:hypothetical protein
MNFLIALEADDITKDVDKEMKKAIGKPSVASSIKNNDNEDEDDIGKTDDLLGTKANKPNRKETDNTRGGPIDNDTSVDEVPGNPENVDEDAPTDDTEDDFTNDETSDIETDSPDENNDNKSEELNNKIRLRENMILFYNILSSNIKLLSEYVPGNNIEANKNTLSTVSNNLVECKTILFNIITEELENKTYVELLRKYIALNRVYDLNIRILDTYFSDLKLLSTKK